MTPNQQFKPGELVCCIGDGLHIECTVISDNGHNYICVEDPLTGRQLFVPREQIDYDLSYYRNKKLENLLNS